MAKKMKKLVALLAAVMMIMSLFAGCGEQAAPTEAVGTDAVKSTDAATEPQAEAAKEFSYPMEAGHTVSVWMWLNGNVSANFADISATEYAKVIAERTGITIEWDASNSVDEDFSIMVASGEYPDVIEGAMAEYPGGASAALADGVIVPLNDIIDQYMPNLKAYLEANPDVEKAIKNDDGVIYGFPSVSTKEAGRANGTYMRADVLEALGKELPTTIDEWYDVLTAMKDYEGVKYPYATTWTNLVRTSALACAYGVPQLNSYKLLLDDDGKVQMMSISDQYKEFLTLLNKWYDEELLDQDIFSMDSAAVKTKLATGEAVVSDGYLASGLQTNTLTGRQNNPDFSLMGVAYPQVVEGVDTKVSTASVPASVGMVMTSSCRDVEAAARYIDYLYSEEGIILNNFGVEGITYNVVDGHYVYTDEVLNNANGWTVSQALANYARAGSGFVGIGHDDYYTQTLVLDEAKESSKLWTEMMEGSLKYRVPNVTMTSEEADTVAKIGTEIATYVDEMTVKFILGTESLDNWDAYVKEIEDMGAAELIAIYDAAVARYNAR